MCGLLSDWPELGLSSPVFVTATTGTKLLGEEYANPAYTHAGEGTAHVPRAS